MNQIEALRRLRTLASPVVETRDVAALLQVSASNATTILRRFAHHGMITHLSRGRWLVNEKIDPLALPELNSALYPAYVSLQSALFHYGLIEQVPSIPYAVTPARPRRLAPGRSRVFSNVPELAIPRRFQWQRLKEYMKLVKSAARRAYIAERIWTMRSALRK